MQGPPAPEIEEDINIEDAIVNQKVLKKNLESISFV
jgi:hypothetical protein